MQTTTFQSTKHTSLRNIFEIRLLVSPQYDIWGMSTKIPYWWCVTIPRSGSYIWLVEANFLHGTNNQKYTQWHAIRVEFLHSFLRHHFRGKPVVALRNVSCFLRLKIYRKLWHHSHHRAHFILHTWYSTLKCSCNFKSITIASVPRSVSWSPTVSSSNVKSSRRREFMDGKGTDCKRISAI